MRTLHCRRDSDAAGYVAGYVAGDIFRWFECRWESDMVVGPRLPERITIVADTIAAFLFVNAFEGELQVTLTGRMGGVLICLFLAMMAFHLAGEREPTSDSCGRRSFWYPFHPLHPLHPFRMEERETTPTTVGRRSHWRHIAIAIPNGAGLLGLGLGSAAMAGWLGGAAFPRFPMSSTRPLMTAMVLVGVILTTRRWFRSPDLRPLAAGLRRGGGWLLGMSVAKAASVAFSEFEFSPDAAMAWAWKSQTFVGFTRAEWLVAASVGLYVAGVLWLRDHTAPESSSRPFPSDSLDPQKSSDSPISSTPSTSSPAFPPSPVSSASPSPSAFPRIAGVRTELVAGMSATLAGILLLIPLPKLAIGIDALFLSDSARWSILTGALAMLAFLRNYRVLKVPYRVVRQSDQALADGVVRQGILATIFLDAAICVTTAGVAGAVWVLLLVVPATMADRYSFHEFPILK